MDCAELIGCVAGNNSEGWAFAKRFFSDFSVTPTGNAGKFGNCVANNRLDNALTGLGTAYGREKRVRLLAISALTVFVACAFARRVAHPKVLEGGLPFAPFAKGGPLLTL